MDYTIIPRYLIYKDRKNISDFENDEIGNLNRNLYRLLRRYIYAEMGMTRYSNIIKVHKKNRPFCVIFKVKRNRTMI